MVLSDRRVALVFRIVAAALIAWGIARVTGLLSGNFGFVQFTYYTVLSNLLCLVWMIALIARTIVDLRRVGIRGWSTPSPRFSAAVMFAITVTMLIYLVVLVPDSFSQGGYTPFTLTDNLIHIFTPIWLIVEWLVFVPKGRIQLFDPLLWTLIPYVYLVFAFIYGALGGRFGGGTAYPYPFMNVDVLGVGGVAIWIVGLTAALMVVAYVFVLIDRLLARFAEARQRSLGRTRESADV